MWVLDNKKNIMTKQELYLKTIFCCMACDGDIADKEVAIVKDISSKTSLLDGLDVKVMLNTYIIDINSKGASFLRKYLNELSDAELTKEEELLIVDLAIKTIEADNVIEYSEVKFFKKIRLRLSLSDEVILTQHPDKEDFLLSDIKVAEDPEWDDIVFNNIELNLENTETSKDGN